MPVPVIPQRYDPHVPLGQLTPHPANPNQGDVGLLCELVDANGFGGAVLAQESTGLIIDGETRWRAALEKGMTGLPVLYLDVDDDTRDRLLASWNESGRRGRNDEARLVALLTGLAQTPRGLEGAAFDGDDLDALIAGLEAKPGGGHGNPDDIPEPPEKPVTGHGDLYLLGPHRLLCGDSTKQDDVTRLLAGDPSPQLVMTSPPYWVGFAYENEKNWPAILQFIRDVSAVLAAGTAADGRIIINTGTVQAGDLTGEGAHMRLLVDEWQQALSANGWLMRYIRFWVKDGGLGLTGPHMDVIDQHTEFLGYFYHRGTHRFRGQERTGEPWAQKGYWSDIPGEARQHGHVASYPAELAARNIRLHSRPGEIVWEPFSGSGTTLIAAHDLNRVCRAMELDPASVDVTCRRFEAFTGTKPERVQPDGTTQPVSFITEAPS